MTRYPEIFTALAADFRPYEVRTRSQGNRQLSYITARTAMNRFDDVLGPENWWDDYRENGDKSQVCILTIRLPDGSTLTKRDAGGAAGMADAGDDDKSTFSDAFKRAAVKFGVGRYLYQDGRPRFTSGAIEIYAEPLPSVRLEFTELSTWAAISSRGQGTDFRDYLDQWAKRRNLGPAERWDEGTLALAYLALVARMKLWRERQAAIVQQVQTYSGAPALTLKPR